MRTTGRNRDKSAFRRVSLPLAVIPPTNKSEIRPDTTAMGATGRNRDKSAFRLSGGVMAIQSPTHNLAVDPERAGITSTYRDGRCQNFRRQQRSMEAVAGRVCSVEVAKLAQSHIIDCQMAPIRFVVGPTHCGKHHLAVGGFDDRNRLKAYSVGSETPLRYSFRLGNCLFIVRRKVPVDLTRRAAGRQKGRVVRQPLAAQHRQGVTVESEVAPN